MGAGASAEIRGRLAQREDLSSLAFINDGFLFEDVEFDPRVGETLLGARFTGADVKHVEWLRPSSFGPGELFNSDDGGVSGLLRLDPTDCLGAVTGYNRDLVVAVQLLCARRPDYLEGAFECYNARVGCCGVWLYHNGKMQLVIIDDRIPCLPRDYSHHRDGLYEHVPLSACLRGGAAWLPLLEKAMAKLHGSYTAAALGDGLRDIIRDLTGDSVIDVSLVKLDQQARRGLFAALHRRFVRRELIIGARKSTTSVFTCEDVQRMSCVFDMIDNDGESSEAEAGAEPGLPPRSEDYLGNTIQGKAAVPPAALAAIRQRAENSNASRGTTSPFRGDEGMFICVLPDEDKPPSAVELASAEEPQEEPVFGETPDDGRAATPSDAFVGTATVGAGRAAQASVPSVSPFRHSSSFKAARPRRPPRWLSWEQMCEDYVLLTVAVLPTTGHVCGPRARLDNPFLKTPASASASEPEPETDPEAEAEAEAEDGAAWQAEHDSSRSAYDERLSGLGATIAGEWSHASGSAGGGAHLPTFRDNPVFRCRLLKPLPRQARLVITLSLPDGRREGEIVCTGGGGSRGGSSSRGGVRFDDERGPDIDLSDWDGDQEGGGALLYPPAAVFIAHDEPSLQHVLVCTDYRTQRDHSIEMELDLSGADYNLNAGGRPVTSFAIIPALLDYGLDSSFSLSAAVIDGSSGLRAGVQLSPLRSFAGWDFTAKLRGSWTVGHTAAGRIGVAFPFSFLNPTWRLSIIPPHLASASGSASASASGSGSGSGSEAATETKTGAEGGMTSPEAAAATHQQPESPSPYDAFASSSTSPPGPDQDQDQGQGQRAANAKRRQRQRDITVHRAQLLLVLRCYPPSTVFDLGPAEGGEEKEEGAKVQALAPTGTTGGRYGNKGASSATSAAAGASAGGSRRGSRAGSSSRDRGRGVGSSVGNRASRDRRRSAPPSSDPLGDAFGLNAAREEPRDYPYDPHFYNSATYILTPAAYARLVHKGGACGDLGPDDGFLGKYLFSRGPCSYRCESITTIGSAAPVTRVAGRRYSSPAPGSAAAAAAKSASLAPLSGPRGKVGYSLGADVHDDVLIMPALWEEMQEGQFELEVFCNLPFVATPVDHSSVPAPIPTVRQRSIEARQAAAKEKEERERLEMIREHRRQKRQDGLQTLETGEFSLEEEFLAPRAKKEQMQSVDKVFYGEGMAGGAPVEVGRTILRDTLTATMPYIGLAYGDEEAGSFSAAGDTQSGDVDAQSTFSTLPTPVPPSFEHLTFGVKDLSQTSVASHITSVRASIAAKIKRDTDARLFSLRMKSLDNSRAQEVFHGVGDSRPLPPDLR